LLGKFLNLIAEWATQIARVLAMLAVAIIIVYVTYSVIARWVFNASVRNVIEISAYMFVALSALALPYVFVSKSHVRIRFLFDRLPEKIRPAINIIGNILTGFYLLVMIISGMKLAIDSFKLNAEAATPLGTPLWIPELLLPVGFALFLFQLITNGFKDK